MTTRSPASDQARQARAGGPEQEPREIAEQAAGVGRQRLDRTGTDILITALIGGLEVSLGSLAAMTVVGAALSAMGEGRFEVAMAVGGLAFPIGFLFVIVGRSELFTENFLIPVVSVLNRERTAAQLLELWALSLVGNLLACVAMALIFAAPEAVGPTIRDGFRAYAAHKLAVPMGGVLASSVLAGFVMTSLTWLLLAVEHPVGRMVAIFSAGYLLFAANLSHSIVGASALFAGFSAAGRSAAEVAGWLAVTVAGNLIGGVGLVTLFRLAQAREGRRKR